MATVKIKFRASSYENKEGSLFYQVIHRRVVRQINSSYKLYPQEWDAKRMKVFDTSPTNESRGCYLASLVMALNKDLQRFAVVIKRLERSGKPFTADDVVDVYRSPDSDHYFISFARNLIEYLNNIGKKNVTYFTTIKSFERFCNGKDFFIDEINSDLMTAYETYLASNGVCLNSISFYMRNLRAIYNRAVEKELTIQRNPFKHVYTGICKTVKRAVPIDVIRKIRKLDLVQRPSMDYARDMFLFSFYTRGMSFVDIAFLKKDNLRNGFLTYRRHKTNQQLVIKWEKPMQDIVDKYNVAETSYLLPVIRKKCKEEWQQYKNEEHRVNYNLKKIGTLVGLDIPLTTYVARHSWASIAKSKNIPVSTISEAMGHDSESTTRIYLASLDTAVIDDANSIILKML